jgi:WD40 repeat protein
MYPTIFGIVLLAPADAVAILSLVLLQGHKNWVLCVAWSPDGAMVASGDMDGNIWLWDPVTGKPLGTCKGHSKWITSLVGALADNLTPRQLEVPPQ